MLRVVQSATKLQRYHLGETGGEGLRFDLENSSISRIVYELHEKFFAYF